MQRRGFLKGLFGGVTAAGLLVTASPQEIEAFASPLVKDSPILLDEQPRQPSSIGQHLYNENGELVAFVTSIDVHVERIDVTTGSDSNVVYAPGHRTVNISAVGVGPLKLSGDGFPRLGSRPDLGAYVNGRWRR